MVIVPIRGQSKTYTIFTFSYLNMKRGNKEDTENEKMDKNGDDNFYKEIFTDSTYKNKTSFRKVKPLVLLPILFQDYTQYFFFLLIFWLKTYRLYKDK